MFTQRLTLRLGAMLVVAGSLVAVPAASADVSDVRDYVRGADQALAKVETLVASNESATAAVKMARANALTRRADKQAGRVEAAKRIRAERLVAKQYDQNADVALESIEEVESSEQTEFAQLVDQALRGRARAVATLTALLDRVPAQAQVGIARAIAAIGVSSNEQLVEVGTVVTSREISPEAAEALTSVVGRLQSALERVQSTLQGVIERLPAQAQAHVQAALAHVTSSITQAIGRLENLFSNLPIGGGPFGGGAPSGGLFG